MFIQTKNREEIMNYLFREGTIVAENKNHKKHPDLPVTNLEVIQLMRGFDSRELVKKRYAWRHYYYFLTDKGVQYLQEQLHIPANIKPATWKKTASTVAPREERSGGWRDNNRGGFGRGGGGDRACYTCGKTGHLARDCPGADAAEATAAAVEPTTVAPADDGAAAAEEEW